MGDAPVVVAYDGSAGAALGLEWAIEHARTNRVPLEVVASTGDLVLIPERSAQEDDDLLGEWLGQAERRLREAGVEEFRTRGTPDKIVPVLIEASKSAALVVVGAQGHGYLRGLVMGSVSQHVARHAHCPVVVVREVGKRGSTRVVVGVDGSEENHKAVEFAFAAAAPYGGPLVAVSGRGLSATGSWDAARTEAEIAEVDPMLIEATDRVRREHPDVPVELVSAPLPPIRAIADASADAALVVVGSRGRGGFAGLLLGSVSAAVLQHAQCPVAVVR
jgi:nucleotide-binding universal stress UspA family protein